MTKLDSLIAGLTMLRAYGCVRTLGTQDNGLFVLIDNAITLHPQDVERIKHEGWQFEENSDTWWWLECD